MYKVSECFTTTKYDRAIIKWTIDELSLNDLDSKTFLVSRQFSTCAAKNRNNWELHLDNNNVHLVLYKERDDAVYVKYEISILNSRGDKNIVQERINYTFSPTQTNTMNEDIKSPPCDITDAINLFKTTSKVRPECNKLTVCCEVIECGLVLDVNEKERNKSVFSDDYKNLWNTKDAADLTLFVGNKEFKAHKAILVARSPVFRAMFTNDSLENNENIVNISDIDANAIKAMLEYIYTDTVEDLDGVAFDLLAAADKYQLDHLKSLCEESLTKSINVTNVLQLSVWADRHHSKQLIQDVIEFFKTEEGVGLIATEEFKDMVKSYPHLSLSILRSFAGV